jgi:hypothetical protein
MLCLECGTQSLSAEGARRSYTVGETPLTFLAKSWQKRCIASGAYRRELRPFQRDTIDPHLLHVRANRAAISQ